MARITIEDCEPEVPNRFNLTVLASQRVKQFANGATPTVSRDNDKDTVLALREIANGSVSIEDLKNSLIESYRQTAFFEEDEEDDDEDDGYDPSLYDVNAEQLNPVDANDDNDVDPEAAIDFSCIIKDAGDEEE